jgi:hypothetical protein
VLEKTTFEERTNHFVKSEQLLDPGMYCNINHSDNFLKLSEELVPGDIQLFLNMISVQMTLKEQCHEIFDFWFFS